LHLVRAGCVKMSGSGSVQSAVLPRHRGTTELFAVRVPNTDVGRFS